MGKGVTMTKKKKLRPKQLELSVVGLNHRVRIESMKKMERELPLKCRLEREPGNLADENAIKVILDDEDFRTNWHIGYLRRSLATVLAPLMDSNDLRVLSAELTELDVEIGTEGLVMVVVESKEGVEI